MSSNHWIFAVLFITPIVVGMLIHRVRYRRLVRRKMAEALHAQFKEEIKRRILLQLSGQDPGQPPKP
ncbi:hypothetical protein [Sinimarinibacterium sp. NLF-5-8]|uniref:hypothetical protein n=1 Tax=Sinimarinibacterium sp. NLF-5-8 TaxID=2698684 RepID=UPI00137B9C86|nr:hypothetical protein [Sinimarinibacterium sp. NLF-5-8]QHS10930.1 hypothetical protein GT972_12760 [Sinimarinibacterium sp. NLF-5-8]